MKIKMFLSRVILWLLSIPVHIYELWWMPGWRQYTIKKGKHYNRFILDNLKPVIVEGGMEFTLHFNSTAVYTSLLPENQYDVNKAWGFSEYLFSTHVNSARVGWHWSGSRLYICAYSYADGVRKVSCLPAHLDEDISCLILLMNKQYIFYINGERIIHPRSSDLDYALGMQLFPYFGGNEKAPHDINIFVKQ